MISPCSHPRQVWGLVSKACQPLPQGKAILYINALRDGRAHAGSPQWSGMGLCFSIKVIFDGLSQSFQREEPQSEHLQDLTVTKCPPPATSYQKARRAQHTHLLLQELGATLCCSLCIFKCVSGRQSTP